MAQLLPNPPVTVDPALSGKQAFYSWQVSAYAGLSMAAAATGNWANPTAAGNSIAPTYSTLNAVTRIPRVVRRAIAGGVNQCGHYTPAATGAPGAVIFPGGADDGGFQMTIVAGVDALVSTVTTTTLLIGGNAGTTIVPVLGAGNAWIGIYLDSAATGLRFGYKNNADAVPTALDGGSTVLPWGAYQAYKVDLRVAPSNSRVFYAASYLNAAGTAWVTALTGSTVAFNPGRVSVAPWATAQKNTVAEQLDLFLANVVIRANTFGALSL